MHHTIPAGDLATPPRSPGRGWLALAGCWLALARASQHSKYTVRSSKYEGNGILNSLGQFLVDSRSY